MTDEQAIKLAREAAGEAKVAITVEQIDPATRCLFFRANVNGDAHELSTPLDYADPMPDEALAAFVRQAGEHCRIYLGRLAA